MPEFKPTASQKAAIETRGRSVLVSAAAGSGKTKVLTERLLSRISEEADIDSFLVITFTKAAAAELRGRITEEISSRLASEPDNRRLRRQSALVGKARIGTIHSFCSSFLREHCHSAGISPDFRVIEETRAETLKAAVIEKVLDEAYEKSDEGFIALADSAGRGRNDKRLSELVLSLFEKMQSHEKPQSWLMEQAESFYTSASDPMDTVWGREILDSIKKTADFWAESMELMLSKALRVPEIHKAYGASLSETAASIRDFSRAIDSGWDRARSFLPISYPRLGSLRNSPDPELSAHIQAVRKSCKGETDKFPKLLSQSAEDALSELRSCAPAVRALAELTLSFDRKYSAEKQRRSELDFNDLEHKTLALLTDEDGSPSELARSYSLCLTEIMVDEYQDVNRVQDSIFRAISREGKNLFMVGDIKQSIYRFRLAEPAIFAEKYESFADIDRAAEGEPARIMLSENFRSRREVIDAINHVFGVCMSKELGEVSYDGNARLRCGADYYEGSVLRPELMLVDTAADDGAEEGGNRVMEALAVAGRIKELISSGTQINDKGGTRALDYGDIAILMRSANSVGEIYSSVLNGEGIPVSSSQGGDFFASLEVSAFICLLAVIDNPHQDVALISALRSPMFGFSADELSDIRAADRHSDFWTALNKRAESDPKCAQFTEKLESLREYSKFKLCSELIRRIFDELDILAIYSAMKDGEARTARLSKLISYATAFESGGFKGLRRFVDWLKKLSEKGLQPSSGESGNAVRIMTVHKSKGLEFPVVFLCDSSHMFNRSDSLDSVLIHHELGFGPSVTNLNKGIEYPTIANLAIKQRAAREMLSDEMRLLYVALTRARERLFITAALKDPERRLSALSFSTVYPIRPEQLLSASSSSVWLMQALLSCSDDSISMSIYRPSPASEPVEEDESAAKAEPSVELVELLRQRLSFHYAHGKAAALPSKLTATELKGYAEPDEESENLVPKSYGSFRKPLLSNDESPITATERGIAVHTLLQFIDYAKTRSEEEIESEIKRLSASNHLSERQSRAIDIGSVLALFSSELGERIARADRLLREFKFSLLCPAELFIKGGEGERILLQGVIDCCIEEDGRLCVIDYKTDNVHGDALAERAEHYKPQLKAYSYALEKMTGKPVDDCILYFIQAKKAVNLKK